jgi:hypothetical protein
MRFDLWNCESLDAARLRDVVYYSSAGFSYLQACELEHVPVQHGSLVRAQDWCGLGASGSRNLALTNTRPEWAAIGQLWRFITHRDSDTLIT